MKLAFQDSYLNNQNVNINLAKIKKSINSGTNEYN